MCAEVFSWYTGWNEFIVRKSRHMLKKWQKWKKKDQSKRRKVYSKSKIGRQNWKILWIIVWSITFFYVESLIAGKLSKRKASFFRIWNLLNSIFCQNDDVSFILLPSFFLPAAFFSKHVTGLWHLKRMWVPKERMKQLLVLPLSPLPPLHTLAKFW